MMKQWMRTNGVTEGSFSGMLLLAFNAADRKNREKLRREFPLIGIAHDKFMDGKPFAMNVK